VQVGRRLVRASVVAVFVLAVSGYAAPSFLGIRVANADTSDLAAASARAAAMIRGHQAADGHWATAVTLGPAYQHAGSEVNVFTPAVIIDLLDPVAAETGLTDVVTRGREYLRRQIESTGLARYHGDPGPVPAAIRGCELPPDADDTALLWRIAPVPDAARLAAARREIERYQDGEGLYRTWLADARAYRCFYVRYAGPEWNPPDVAVEMHVYMFLAEHDRAAAGRLCEALRRRIDDDRIWIWYTVAPFIPLLREIDMARAGCAIRIPQSRLDRAVAGQEPYLTLATLLRTLLVDQQPPGSERSPEPYLRALREVAAGNFAAIAKTPPLVYHNDLAAFPPHYHWSTDVGYALWLRLYAELTRRGGSRR
jgi:hypothetical protein